jgi:hypothetical protein
MRARNLKPRTKSRALAIGGLVLLLLATSTASAGTLQLEFDAADYAPGAVSANPDRWFAARNHHGPEVNSLTGECERAHSGGSLRCSRYRTAYISLVFI